MPSPRVTRNISRAAVNDLAPGLSGDGLVNADGTGLGADLGVADVASSTASPIAADGGLGSLVMIEFETLDDLVLVDDVSGAAKEGGVKIGTLPKGLFVPLAVTLVGTLSLSASTATTSAGEIAVGHTIAAGTSATIGAATEESILDGTALANFAAATPQDIAIAARAEADQHDGTATARDIYINATITAAVAQTDLVLAAGAKLRIWGLFVDEAAIAD